MKTLRTLDVVKTPGPTKKQQSFKHSNRKKQLSKGWNLKRKAKRLAAKKARKINRSK